ncbi:MAG: 50S ribosomal protein L2 [Patescibacteria group bacterium]
MPVKKYKPTTPGRRISSVLDVKDVVVQKRPEKSLTSYRKKRAGRNNQGKITVRHRGGGAKRLYREIDFTRTKFDVPAKVATIEYDPNRSSHIALLQYADGAKSYIIAPDKLEVGMTVVASQGKTELEIGYRMPLKHIPAGTVVHAVELKPGKGATLARSAGSSITIMGIDKGFAQLKMPSGEVRLVPESCSATIGQVGNLEHGNVRLGKAGRKRHLGWRPTVRGKVMNPVDHPHGGGEAANSIGMKHPKTPWGKPALGVKTRKKKKPSNALILRRRKKRRR